VVLKSIPPLRVAGIRDRVLFFGDVDPLLDELSERLQKDGVSLPPASPPLGIYYDAAFRERGLDMEIALPLRQRLTSDRRVRVHELPGVETMACVLHRGPYSEVSEAYQALVHWVDSSGYQIDGPNRDLYLQRAPAVESGEEVTEVQFPIKPRPYLSRITFPKEHKEMETKIVTKPAFTVAGMEYFGKNENDEIAQMWGEFNPRSGEVKSRTEPQVAYGVCGEMGEDGRFHYVAGFKVEPGSEQPDDMRTWDVPEQTYAVFPSTLQTIHDTYQYAFQTWIPQSEYEHAPGPDFELYDKDFDSEKGTGLYIYIPVKKK
jgi:predicted transcriptional regulator YdeE